MPTANSVDLIQSGEYLSWVPTPPRKKKKETVDMSTPVVAMEGFTFGCDPELFVVDEDGVAVCPDYLPGTKDNPYPVECGAVQRDGMAAEFNINPVSTFEEFDHNIVTVLSELEKMLPKGHKLVAVPSMVFSEDVMADAPIDAQVLGCSPDFNAWTGKVNPPPSDPDNPFLRTASGHLHFGWTKDAPANDLQHIIHCRDLVKQLDWFLGGWSLDHDSDPTRRRLYGNAGACRYKPYGVEYRVLSNFWVTDKDLRLQVWNRMNRAIHEMRKMYMPEQYLVYKFNEKLIQSINSGEKDPSLFSKMSFPFTTLNH